MAGLENPIHLLVILVVVLLVFGPSRLPDMGRSLGDGMRKFRESLSSQDEDTEATRTGDQMPATLEPTSRPPKSPET